MIEPLAPEPTSQSLFQRVWAFVLSLVDALLGQHGFEVSKTSRRAVAALLLVLAAALAWATLHFLGTLGAVEVPADHRDWENILQARLIGFRLRVVVGLSAGVVAGAVLAFQGLDHTRLGKRLWHWSPGMDSDATCAAKTRTAGLCFIGLVLAFALLAAQVLR